LFYDDCFSVYIFEKIPCIFPSMVWVKSFSW
jgi:hypothetical protein